ncbi:MAG: hypothetical protein LBQ35_05945 [Spirochaetaceae bacterium]|jgi:hypothetical protein|nr:hypothetical protein [Spirochaetaceae bacterium]
MKRITLLVCALSLGLALPAADFGLLLNTTAGYGSPGTQNPGPGFSGSLSPWFSAGISGKLYFYFSSKVSLSWQDGLWGLPPLVELERTEFNYRPLPAFYLSLGRIYFRDPAGLIAGGLFDGASATLGLGLVRLTAGLHYTGFLYKKTAAIILGPEDAGNYDLPLDYGSLDTYFATRRILASLTGELPDLSPRSSLAFSALAQFDMNGAERVIHSQYLEARYGLEAAEGLRLTLTGLGGLMEDTGRITGGLMALAAAEWEFPGSLRDMVMGEFFWGTGAGTLDPVRPVSGITRGMVFRPTLPGLMDARLVYRVRLSTVLSAEAAGGLFWRTDLSTLQDDELSPRSKSRFLGGEAYAQAIWAPQSVLRLNAGGGVFFPGRAFSFGTALRWKADLGVLFSL